MSTLPPLIDPYLEGTVLLRQAIAGMTPEQLRARPVAGKWSTLEVVCHIVDFEPILADRMKRIIALDRPPLLVADENDYARALAYHDRDPAEELALMAAVRAQMASILRTLPDSALTRVGIHSERGELTLERLLTGATNHVTHHLAFIADKRRALGV